MLDGRLLLYRKCLSSEVNDILETCNYYYFQSTSKYANFQHAMCSPSKVMFVVLGLFVDQIVAI